MIEFSKTQLQLEALTLELQLRIGVKKVLQNYFEKRIIERKEWD